MMFSRFYILGQLKLQVSILDDSAQSSVEKVKDFVIIYWMFDKPTVACTYFADSFHFLHTLIFFSTIRNVMQVVQRKGTKGRVLRINKPVVSS